ncbi:MULTISPECIES: helix-turn-helix domain-containing protein [Lactiplantibacillus]|uniref:helix-turn-helix domain-containing protein n=1 Tax=Lactiplantibacillus TaxID=2767842 RepID=UPI000977239A|nr:MULTISPECIES: helix-turn-helix transcriptional regulator [Lactiplantibacillus]MBA3080482.1 helix-turn-helix transcriptional regulator [Lactiplantibacillus plantarum]MBP5810166.1 helix-turn-helix transcriptional regulator [Lactiplantibacillus argentoratensis]MCC6115618.1 helix-turn-helix domain-containing protein [Lactiplantibacillus plantarum]MCW6113166.1 helix-turn-helix domain-containing protein [Lactiplantibacillus plantarum]MDB7779225.1 helix-turn-helix transcriptional regulator [Lactip
MSYQINLELVKKSRLNKGLTQQQMADMLGLDSKSSYSKRENGDTNFKSNEVPALAEILGLEIDFKNFFSKTLRKKKLSVKQKEAAK